MLEKVDLNSPELDKSEYKERKDALMEKLILLQQQAREKQVGLVVLFAGWNGSGKGSRISDILYLLDARATSVVHTIEPDPETISLFSHLENGVTGFNPIMKPFWEGLGERGTMTLFENGWYNTIEAYMLGIEHDQWHSEASRHMEKPRVPYKKLTKRIFKPREELDGGCKADKFLESIASWEKGLTDNGYMVVKFFLHISKKAQKERLENLYSNPETRWRVSDEELLRCADYDDFYKIHDELLERSDFDFAPWHLLNGENKREANLEIAQTIVAAFEEGLAKKEAQEVAPTAQIGAPTVSRFPICTDYPNLDEVEHDLILDAETYRKELKKEHA